MLYSRKMTSCLCFLMAIGVIISVSGNDAQRVSRIYGGQLATGSEYKTTVTLSYPGQFLHTCGGAILGPRHVLTAAHCVDTRRIDEINVRAGIVDIRDLQNVVERFVKRIIVHPDYMSYIPRVQNIQDDLAILVLDRALPINDHIQIIMLPTLQAVEGNEYHMAGWGRNGPPEFQRQYELKTLTMTVGYEDECHKLSPRTICAYSKNGTACRGDSGSPLVGGDYVYGIASMSDCQLGSSVNFVNVHDYLDWIKNAIKEDAE